jgi:hypothetical protein
MTEKTPAGLDGEVLARLKRVDMDIANGYVQVTRDLEDGSRISYRGTAGELREVLTWVPRRVIPFLSEMLIT